MFPKIFLKYLCKLQFYVVVLLFFQSIPFTSPFRIFGVRIPLPYQFNYFGLFNNVRFPSQISGRSDNNFNYYNENRRITQITDLIQLQRYQSAAIELSFQFPNKNDRVPAIGKIIKEITENRNNDEKSFLDNIFGFLIAQHQKQSNPSCVAIQNTVTSLLDRIASSQYLPVEVLTLANILESDCYPEQLSSEPLDEIINSLVQNWAKGIIKNYDFNEISKFCSKVNSVPILSKYLKIIVTTAYSENPTNFDKVNKFIESLDCDPNLKLSGWSILLDTMKSQSDQGHSDGTLRLAYLVKQFEWRSRVRLILDRDLNYTLNFIKENIPDKIRNVTWSNKCTIMNQKSGKYILPTKTGTLQMERSIGSGNTGDFNYNEGWWHLEKFDNSGGVIFAIKIMQIQRNKPFLCVNNTESESLLRTCYKTGAKENVMVLWNIEPVNLEISGVNQKGFWIYTKSKMDSMRYYLYQTGEAVKTRGIDETSYGDNHNSMLEGPESQAWEDSLWNIECKVK